MKMGMYLHARRALIQKSSRDMAFICNILMEIIRNECGITDTRVCNEDSEKYTRYDAIKEFFPEFLEMYDGVYWTLQGNSLRVDDINRAWFEGKDIGRRISLLDALINHRDAAVYRG